MLEVRQLTVSYGGVRAIDGISLTVQPGEIVSIVGMSGTVKARGSEVEADLTYAEEDVAGHKVDSVAPTVSSVQASVGDLSKIRITWSEALDTTLPSAPGGFTVDADTGTDPTVSSMALDGDDAKVLELTLSADLDPGKTYTLAYTAPETDPVKDVPGNAAAGFGPRAVGLSTPATGQPVVSGTATLGSLLAVSTSGIADAEGKTKAEAGESGFAYTYQWVRVDGMAEADITGT